MGGHKLFYQDAKTIRDQLNEATAMALIIHEKEQALVQILYGIDQKKFYARPRRKINAITDSTRSVDSVDSV